jgi:hypothetical protein
VSVNTLRLYKDGCNLSHAFRAASSLSKISRMNLNKQKKMTSSERPQQQFKSEFATESQSLQDKSMSRVFVRAIGVPVLTSKINIAE